MVAAIPPNLEAFIQSEVASGKHASADEAVSEAVRLLRERERHLARLRTEIEVGMTAFTRGEFTAMETDANRQALIDDIQRRGRERLAAAQELNSPFAESAKLEAAIGENLKGLGFGDG